MFRSPGDATPRQTRRRWGFAAIATVAVLVAIVWFSRPDTIAQVTGAIGWSGAVIVLGLYSTTQVLRTARIWFSLPLIDRPTFGSVLSIVAIHQCLNHLLPLRLGEAGFPILMKRYASVSAATSISLLLVVRLQELVVLVLFFAAALVGRFFQVRGSLPVGALLMIAAAGALVLALTFRTLPVVLHFASAILRRPQPFRGLAASKERLATFLDRLRIEWSAPVSPARRGFAWLLTFAIWFNTCFISFEGLRFSGFKISFVDTILGSTVASLSHVLPINAFGSFGSLEAGWTFGFAALGFDARGVLAVAFVLHILLMLFLIVAALVAWAWLQSRGPGIRARP